MIGESRASELPPDLLIRFGATSDQAWGRRISATHTQSSKTKLYVLQGYRARGIATMRMGGESVLLQSVERQEDAVIVPKREEPEGLAGDLVFSDRVPDRVEVVALGGRCALNDDPVRVVV